MKKITFTFLLALASLFVFAQSKFQAGVYAEGGYFFPKSVYSEQNINNKFATGIGVYGSYNILKKLSVSLGAGYRYKSNDANMRFYHSSEEYGYGGYGGFGEDVDYGPNIGYDAEKRTYKQHYFVIPLKLRYLFSEKLFVEAGVEAARLLNYDKVTIDQLSDAADAPYHDFLMEKTEYDWVLGFGYKFSPKFSASINYKQGFDEQSMGSIKNLEDHYGQRYKNRMLMLNISYNIFGVKQ